jgi:hypothetical protein
LQQQKRARGGNVKQFAPSGYYTAKEAANRLGLNRNTFYYYVKTGKIKRDVPPGRTEGFYKKREIDELATEIELYLHAHASEEEASEARVARPEDVQGIYDVLDSYGWQTASVAQRLSWYRVNPYIDYVVLDHGRVMGYITAVPYTEAAMADMMAGRRRAWHIRPDDIRAYRPGGTYDLYVGIAIHKEEDVQIPGRPRWAFRLIAGFFSFLVNLADQQITIRRLYAVSAEKPGQRTAQLLGFEPLLAEPGDLFPRFALDLETSESHFARAYRELLTQKQATRKEQAAESEPPFNL